MPLFIKWPCLVEGRSWFKRDCADHRYACNLRRGIIHAINQTPQCEQPVHDAEPPHEACGFFISSRQDRVFQGFILASLQIFWAMLADLKSVFNSYLCVCLILLVYYSSLFPILCAVERQTFLSSMSYTVQSGCVHLFSPAFSTSLLRWEVSTSVSLRDYLYLSLRAAKAAGIRTECGLRNYIRPRRT